MGLDVVAKGMPNFRLAYSTYYMMRRLIVKEAYGDRCEEIFRKQYASEDESFTRLSISGADSPFSHFAIDCLDTLIFSAIFSCVY